MMTVREKETKQVIQKVLDKECPGVILHIIQDFRLGCTELRFCGPTIKSVYADPTITIESLGEACRAVIDEFILEARAMSVENLAEIYDYDS